jgi:hypothetical protein
VPGTYTITSFCEHSDPLPADELCPGATVAMSDADLSGVVVFSDATNYVTGVSETIHSVLYWPASCLGKLGGPTTCAELQQRFGPDQADTSTTPTTVTATCSGTDSCMCMETDTKASSAMGTYSTLGNVLTFSPSDNGISDTPGTPLAYCVSGNQIAISETSQIGTASVSLFMVLTLQ